MLEEHRQGAYLYVAIVLFGDEGDLHWEEVTGLPCYAELQAAALGFGIDHWQAPLEEISPAVVAILTIDLPDHWGADTGPRASHEKLQWLICIKLRKRLSSPSAWQDRNPERERNRGEPGRHVLVLPGPGALLTARGWR